MHWRERTCASAPTSWHARSFEKTTQRWWTPDRPVSSTGSQRRCRRKQEAPLRAGLDRLDARRQLGGKTLAGAQATRLARFDGLRERVARNPGFQADAVDAC